MNKTEEGMEKLQRVVKEGREYFDRNNDLNLGYINRIVNPALENVLENLCLEIEEHHKITKPEEEKYINVIHYTNINTLVSMLQQATKNKQNVTKDNQDASLRLYDSVHFNDPDEGNYFSRNLNLPKKYDWLGKKKESHAYIASFIIPESDSKKDVGDNLVFWRTYGREGEGCSLKIRIPKERLREVLYGDSKAKCTGKLLRPILDSLHPLTSIAKQKIKEGVREKLAEIIWKSLEKICYLYKSKAYEYEHECRFIIPDIDESKICFEYQEQRNSTPCIRHYYEDDALSLEKILTSDSVVTLGPCVPYHSDVSNCLKIMRDRAGLKHRLQIKTSEIAYRKS